MIYWAQLLHFYQPSTQMASVLKRICDESYRPLLRVLEEYPYARLTINFNATLTRILSDCGHQDVIDGFAKLAERGQIELTGSAMYHPILPLIPTEEVSRQISLNTNTNRRFFGKVYAPEGFFPPEMCYSRDILPAIIDAGYQWLILSGVACPGEWPVDTICKVESDDQDLPVFFRDDVLSNRISFKCIEAKDFITHLQQWKGSRENIYVITAMDAETFGHHIKGWERAFLAEVYERLKPSTETADIRQKRAADPPAKSPGIVTASRQIKMVAISDLLQLFSKSRQVEPKASSWSTSTDDIANGNIYPLWLGKGNEVHRLQWEHLGLCIEMVNKALKYANTDESRRFAIIARKLLDHAEQSDQMWWASKRPSWDINLIHFGMILQLRVVVNAFRAISKSNIDDKTKQESYYRVLAARDIRNRLEEHLFND